MNNFVLGVGLGVGSFILMNKLANQHASTVTPNALWIELAIGPLLGLMLGGGEGLAGGVVGTVGFGMYALKNAFQ